MGNYINPTVVGKTASGSWQRAEKTGAAVFNSAVHRAAGQLGTWRIAGGEDGNL
jgi:hypothetical protein